MNLDELRAALDRIAGPARSPSMTDLDAVRRRARRDTGIRVAVAALAAVLIVGVAIVAIRPFGTGNEASVTSARSSGTRSWVEFCAQATAIQTANESPDQARTRFQDFPAELDELQKRAPTKAVRSALDVARPFLQVSTRKPNGRSRAALQTLNDALTDHCQEDVASVFKIGYEFLIVQRSG